MYLSQNIRYLRKKVQYSQTELGQRANKTKEVISTYERGVTTPPLEVLISLCKLFEVSLDDMVFRDLEKEGRSGKPAFNIEKANERSLQQLNHLMSLRINELEREIRRHNPELAKELGIKKGKSSS